MQQNWHIRSRAHHCALTERPFEEGEKHHTAIYFDTKTGEFTRRDICNEAWEQELAERTPFSHWRSVYEKHVTEAKPEITPKESAIVLLQRLIDEDQAHTEHARYILALMLERKRVLSPTATKENDEGHRLLFYENKKTGDVYMVRDPELRLDEIASVQEEVANLLGFGGPVAEAAKVAGVTLGADGKVIPKDAPAPAVEAEPSTEASPAVDEVAPEAENAADDEEDSEDLDAEEEEELEEDDSEEDSDDEDNIEVEVEAVEISIEEDEDDFDDEDESEDEDEEVVFVDEDEAEDDDKKD